MKKLLVVFMSLLITVSFCSCNKNDADIHAEQTTINSGDSETESTSKEVETQSTTVADETTTVQEIETTTADETEAQTQAQWTTSMIIDTYKKAAAATHKNTKLQQTISLTDISVNDGGGTVNSVLKLVKPIIASVVSSNSSEINGITGGYTQLVESDLNSAEAYTKNSKTIIKMIPKEQKDSKLISEDYGTVGHLIFVVGDISSVLGQMSDSGLPIEITNENISAVYVAPSVNITINKDGIIENGTWRYTVTLTLSNFKVSGKTVDNASVTMDNIITLNGGFSE